MNEKSYETNTVSCNEAFHSVLNVHLWFASTKRHERSRARLCTAQKKTEKNTKMKKTKGRRRRRRWRGRRRRRGMRRQRGLGKLSLESGPGIVTPCGGSRGTDYFRVKTNLARRGATRGSREAEPSRAEPSHGSRLECKLTSAHDEGGVGSSSLERKGQWDLCSHF